ncbi:MAG: hypothetical protein JO222_13490 [Frankiales bacterium]|nr:hypothetical protein [Frankiales bacterium]
MSIQAAYRLGDGAPVTLDAARAIWAAVAREVLEGMSSTGSVSHSELARQVQQLSGVYTRMPVAEWLPEAVSGLDARLTARLRVDAPRTVAGARTAGARRAPATGRVRATPAVPKRETPPPAICPTCFMQLPASGRCDTCA